MNKGKENITGTDVAIICSVLGIAACIVLVIDAFLSGESKALPMILLCTCSANLCANVKVKRDEKNR